MKKPKITTDECAIRVQAAVDALVNEGATWDMIVPALVTVAIRGGQNHRRPEFLFDEAMKAFVDAATTAAEKTSADRAAKRRKSLGLPEE